VFGHFTDLADVGAFKQGDGFPEDAFGDLGWVFESFAVVGVAQ